MTASKESLKVIIRTTAASHYKVRLRIGPQFMQVGEKTIQSLEPELRKKHNGRAWRRRSG